MGDSEKRALGRVLMVLKSAYAEISRDNIKNPVALLDMLSAAISHINDAKRPISKLLPKLRRDIKSANKEFSRSAELYFKSIYPIPDYDFDKAVRHIPAIIHGNDMICEKYVRNEREKAKSMCDAMKSYPGFLFGEFESLSDRQFYDLVFGYYPKLYDKEDFMGKMRYLFE